MLPCATYGMVYWFRRANPSFSLSAKEGGERKAGRQARPTVALEEESKLPCKRRPHMVASYAEQMRAPFEQSAGQNLS